MVSEEKCRYCGDTYQNTDGGEHVFPYGLGGENLNMDCVCSECNGYFSGLERELYQKSVIGLMRSTEGIEGYKPSIDKPAPFKAQILLMPDTKNGIVYEVGQFREMRIFVRPQIINIKDQYYIEADTQDGVLKLTEKFKQWKASNLKMVVRMPLSKNDTVGYIEFKQVDNHFISEPRNEKIKIKHEILFDILPESHELHTILTPRLFIDDDNKLRVRARTHDEAINFIQNFLAITLNPITLNSFSGGNLDEPTISVGFSFDSFKSEQALVKIGINCLIYYFPEIKHDDLLNDCISFVKSGLPLIKRHLEEKSSIIDSCENTHNVFFHQIDNAVRIRISLFNGGFIFTFYVQGLRILRTNEYNRLVIDYSNRVNKFENQVAFFESFNKKRTGNNE